MSGSVSRQPPPHRQSTPHRVQQDDLPTAPHERHKLDPLVLSLPGFSPCPLPSPTPPPPSLPFCPLHSHDTPPARPHQHPFGTAAQPRLTPCFANATNMHSRPTHALLPRLVPFALTPLFLAPSERERPVQRANAVCALHGAARPSHVPVRSVHQRQQAPAGRRHGDRHGRRRHA